MRSFQARSKKMRRVLVSPLQNTPYDLAAADWESLAARADSAAAINPRPGPAARAPPPPPPPPGVSSGEEPPAQRRARRRLRAAACAPPPPPARPGHACLRAVRGRCDRWGGRGRSAPSAPSARPPPALGCWGPPESGWGSSQPLQARGLSPLEKRSPRAWLVEPSQRK